MTMHGEHEKGFTLIEMIVVVGIVVVVPVIVVANFSQIRLQFALARATHQFAADLSYAQAMALSQTPYTNSLGQQQEFAGYGVYVGDTNLGAKKYVVYADAPPGNQRYDSLDHIISLVDLAEAEPGIAMKADAMPAGMSIQFDSRGRAGITVSGQPQLSTRVVFVTESRQPKTSSVLVNSLGFIDIQ